MILQTLLGAALALAPGLAQAPSLPAPASSKTDPTSRIERIFSDLQAQGAFNGVVLVAEGDRVRLAKSYGWADFATKRPLTLDSVFELASLSKGFTAMGVALLAEEGKLGLEDPVTKFLPELPYPGLTLRHLLTHTSGLPREEELLGASWPATKTATNADILRVLAEQRPPVRFAPGEKWEYLNTGYTLLALVLERVSGTAYADFLRQRVFEPLGMKDTCVRTVLSREQPKDLALGFMRRSALKEDFVLPSALPVHGFMTQFGGLVGARNVHSTAGDLLRWILALRGSRLVKAATLAQVLAPVRLRDGSVARMEVGAPVPSAYGLGWFLRTDAPGAYWHTGGYPGYSTFLEWDQDHGRAIIVLDNSFHSRTTYMAGHATAALLEGRPFTLGRVSIAEAVGPLVLAQGAAVGLARYRELKAAKPEAYRFDEEELNRLGYDLVEAGRLADAVAILAFNVELFPQSANAYDSLGEACLKQGDKPRALSAYEQSVKLDPENEGGRGPDPPAAIRGLTAPGEGSSMGHLDALNI